MAKKTMPAEMPQRVEDPSMDDEPKDYEVDDAVRTLERGEEIKKDKKLMPHVHKKIGKKMKSLAELKKMAPMKAMEERGESKKMEDSEEEPME